MGAVRRGPGQSATPDGWMGAISKDSRNKSHSDATHLTDHDAKDMVPTGQACKSSAKYRP